MILDGVNRTSSEAVAVPFLSTLDGKALRTRVGGSQQLSLVATLSASSMTLPVAQRLWKTANLHLSLEGSQSVKVLSERPAVGVCDEALLEQFASRERGSWRNAVQTFAPSLRFNEAQARRADQLEAALKLLGGEGLPALRMTLECALSPGLAECDPAEVIALGNIPGLEEVPISQQRLKRLYKEEGSCTIQ